MDQELIDKIFKEKITYVQAMATVMRYRNGNSDFNATTKEDCDLILITFLADEFINKQVECPECSKLIRPYGKYRI